MDNKERGFIMRKVTLNSVKKNGSERLSGQLTLTGEHAYALRLARAVVDNSNTYTDENGNRCFRAFCPMSKGVKNLFKKYKFFGG